MSNREGLEDLLYKVRRARWLHRRSASHFEPRNKFFVVLAIIIPISIAIINEIGRDDSGNLSKGITTVISIVSLIASGVSAIKEALGYGISAKNHKLSAKAYDNLVTKINSEAKFPQTHINTFSKYVEEEILKIKNSYDVYPPNWVVMEFNMYLQQGIDLDSENNMPENQNNQQKNEAKRVNKLRQKFDKFDADTTQVNIPFCNLARNRRKVLPTEISTEEFLEMDERGDPGDLGNTYPPSISPPFEESEEFEESENKIDVEPWDTEMV